MPLSTEGATELNSSTIMKKNNSGSVGDMEQSINILYDWAQKQEHFVKKDYSRQYLESFIVVSKGSVEKAKAKLDRICTMRTIVPRFFEKYDAKNDFKELRDFFLQVKLPELTDDNIGIVCAKVLPSKVTSSAVLEACQYCVIHAEYLKCQSHNHEGYHIIGDVRDVNSIMDYVTHLNLIDLRNMITLIIEGYGMRVKSIYLIYPSKTIEILVRILKQFVTEKIGKRIQVVKTLESLHEVFPKRLLPKDFGGEQKSILELFDEQTELLSAERHISHMIEMKQARTNEELRRDENFKGEYLGMPGSFKTLNVD